MKNNCNVPAHGHCLSCF